MLFWALIAVTGFNALSALGGGIAMLVTDGMGMPASFLADGPFTSFLWPGIILLLVVGGSQLLALGLLVGRRESALLWSAVSGFGMLIWIFVETGMIRGMSWLQVIYFTTGAVQLILVVALLGAAAWLPRTPLAPARILRSPH